MPTLFALLLLSQAAAAEVSHAQIVQLQPGMSLMLRADAKLAKEFTPPPENLVRAQAWKAGSWVLLINVGKEDGKACDARLKEERARGEAALKKPDPAMTPTIKFQEVSAKTAGKAPALYTRVRTRSAAEAQADKPYRDGAGYLICTRKAFVNLTLALVDGADLTAAQLVEFDGIAASIAEK